MPTIAEQAPARASLLYDPKVRAIAYQVVLTVVVVGLIYTAASNAVANLRAARIASARISGTGARPKRGRTANTPVP